MLGQYLLLGLAWGASFLFIKVGLEGLSPAHVVLGRLVAGAVTLGVVSVVARLLVGSAGVVVVLGPWRDVGGGGLLAQGGCLLATASYGLAFVYLRRYVSPLGIAAIPTATVQVGLGIAVLHESVSWNEPVGAVVVVLGIAISRGRPATAFGPGREPTTSSSSRGIGPSGFEAPARQGRALSEGALPDA